MRSNPLLVTLRAPLAAAASCLLALGPLRAADHPIDTNDPRQVRAEAFVTMPSAQATALVPTQIPLIPRWDYQAQPDGVTFIGSNSKAKCPDCGNSAMSWTVNDPDHMTCMDCSTVLPGSAYPENATLTMDTWRGKTVSIPYHDDGSGGSYFFKGVIDSFKHRYLHDALDDCAYTYDETQQSTRFAERMQIVYLQYAGNFDDWICADGGGFTDYDTTKNNQALFDDEWGYRHSFTLPDEILRFYQVIYDDPALQTAAHGTTSQAYIDTNLFEVLVDYKMSYPEEFGIHNNLGTDVRSMLQYGWHFGWPKCMHYSLRWARNSRDLYSCGYDGMSLEGVGYHYLWLASFLNVLELTDWTDPPGYLDAVDGTRIDHPLTADEILPPGPRMHSFAAAPIRTTLPNGTAMAVHDAHGSISSYGHGGWHRIEGPTVESRNRILPSFGHVVLGDGRDDRQVQSQLHFSQYGNHASHDSLTFQFYANGRSLFEYPAHQNYTRSLINKNAVAVDHQTSNVYRANIKGMVELHAPTLPGLAVTRVQCDRIVFDHPKKMSRYRRTLLQNTVELDHPYVLDIFEVEGGALHEYLLAGSMYYPQSAAANITMTPVTGDTPFHESGDDSIWERFGTISSGTITAATHVDFTYDDQPQQGARLHLAAMAGDELLLSRLTTVNEESYNATPDRPHLMIRRGSPDPVIDDFVSTFVVVHEAFDGAPVISNVTFTNLGNGSLAVTVTLPDRIDTYLISRDGPKTMSHGSLSANATIAAFSEHTTGSASDIWLVGGTQAATATRSLTVASPEHSGQLLGITRTAEGAPFDSVLTDAPLPGGRALTGQLLLVEGYDQDGTKTFVNGYEIEEILVDSGTGQREVRLRQPPGLRLDPDGSVIEEIYFPNATAATHTVRLVGSHSTVPAIVHVSPGIAHHVPEAAVVCDGRAIDQSVTPNVSVVPAAAEIRFTTDGSEPDASSPAWGTGVALTADTRLHLQPTNPGGITVPRVRRERYYTRKTAETGTPIGQGLAYQYQRYGEQRGTIPNLRNESLESFLFRGINLDLRGYLQVPQTGLYRFFARCDSDVTLKVAGETIIHQVGLRSISPWEGEVYLEAGYHAIEVDYYSFFIPWFEINWSGPGFDRQPIPNSAFVTGLRPDGVTLPLDGCILWLDANDLDGDGIAEAAAEDGAGPAVAAWADKSGVGNHATQTDAARKPALVTGTLNGKPVIRCDGTDDVLQFPALDTIRTVFWVLKDDAVGQAVEQRRPLLGHTSIYNFHRDHSSIWHGGYAANGIKNGITRVDEIQIDGTSTNLTFGYHLVALQTTEAISANLLASDRYITGRSWMGDIAEVLVYDIALSETDRSAVEAYLYNKWFHHLSATGYGNWIAGFPSLSGNDILETADPDRDGLVNFLEYAFSLDPTTRNFSPDDFLPVAGSDDAEFTVPNLRDGVTYEVQTSTDLSTWDPHLTLPGITGGSPTIVTIPAALAGSAGQLFVRIRIEENIP